MHGEHEHTTRTRFVVGTHRRFEIPAYHEWCRMRHLHPLSEDAEEGWATLVSGANSAYSYALPKAGPQQPPPAAKAKAKAKTCLFGAAKAVAAAKAAGVAAKAAGVLAAAALAAESDSDQVATSLSDDSGSD